MIVYNILFALFSIILAIMLVSAVRKNKAIKSINQNLKVQVAKTQKVSKRRKKQEEALRIEDGGQEKESFFYKIDLSLEQSGISKILPFVNTEIFFVIIIVSAAAAFGIGIKRTFLVGVMAAFVTVFLYYVLIYLLTSSNYRKTEEQIVSFAGMLKNYSRTSDDILTILRNTAFYIEEPLKSVVMECYTEATTTGDVSGAMTKMALKVEHKEFKKIVNNMEMCSRHKANYGVIIDRSRDQIRAYVAAREEDKQMVNVGRLGILMILGVGALSMYMINGLPEEGIIQYLQQSMGGQVLLFYLFCVVLYTLWSMVSIGKKEK